MRPSYTTRPSKSEDKLDAADVFVLTDLSIEQIVALAKGRRGWGRTRLYERYKAEEWEKKRTEFRDQQRAALVADIRREGVDRSRARLDDAVRIQGVGRVLLGAAGAAIERIGGVQGLLGPNPEPALILRAIATGAEVLQTGMTIESELLGPGGDRPLPVLEIRLRPAKPHDAPPDPTNGKPHTNGGNGSQ